jgi:accessory gene regulator protein AgrB
MSIPLIVGLLAFVIVIGAAAGVWRAQGRGANTTQSSVMLLLLAVVAVVLVWFVLQGR